MNKKASHWAVERGKGKVHAIVTYDVTTPVPGPRTVYRASFDFGFEPPSADSTVVVAVAATKLKGSFVSLDVDVPPTALSNVKEVVVVQLDGPREVRRVEVTSSKAGAKLELRRIDKDQPAPQATVSATVGAGNAATVSGFVDVRFAIGVGDGSLTKTDVAKLRVRGQPTGPRLGLADPGAAADPLFFWPTPKDSGNAVDAGAAFAQALQAYLTDRAGDPSPSARLVIQSDQPCRFLLTAFDTASSFAVDGFAAPELVASDLPDPAALAARIRGAGDPVSAHLRSAIGASSLLDGLNGVLAGPLYDGQRFAGVTLSAQTQAALAAGETPRLNRLLLQDAYPDLVAAPSAKRVLRFETGSAAAAAVAVRLPAGATVSKATLSTQESLRDDRPLDAALVGAEDARAGLHVGDDGSVAASIDVAEAVTATGLALPLLALSPVTEIAVELQEDWRGAPSGSPLAAGAVAPGTPGRPGWTRMFFDPVVLASGAAWIVLRAGRGAAVWLAAQGSGTLRVVRAPDHGAVCESVLHGLEPLFELYSRSGGVAALPAVELRLGGAPVPGERDGDRTSYDLATALQAALDQSGGTVPLTFAASVPGTVSVFPPHVEYSA